MQSSSGLRIPFDRSRLARSVERARTAPSAQGETLDRAELPEEIADIVAFTLRNRMAGGESNGSSIGEGALGELVERALIELGAVATARTYIVTRDRRSRSNAARTDGPGKGPEREHGSTGESPVSNPAGGASRLPMVRGASGAEPFHARRIVGALMEEAALLPEEAEQVARRVEETLRSASLHSVSTALIRELVSNELLALGLRDALKRHEAIGIPRHDLGELFHSARAVEPATTGCGDPAARAAAAPRFEQSVASALLRKWSLTDLLSTDVADAHLRGDIHVEALHAPHRALYRAIAVDLVRSPAAPVSTDSSGRLAPFALIEGAVELAKDVELGLFLEGVGTALLPLDGETEVAAWLLALGGAAASASRSVDFVAPTRPSDPRTPLPKGLARTVAVLLLGADRALSHGTSIPRSFLQWEELVAALEREGQSAEPVADAAERLLGTGHLVPTWCEAAGTRCSGPGMIRRTDDDPQAWSGSLALDSAISINLPRVARKAGPWREDAFLMGLNDTMEACISAALERSEFIGRARAVHGVAARDRSSFGIVPVGLYEALRILGDGLARADQGARILGFLHDAAVRKGSERGLEVRVVSSMGSAAPIRFAALDAQSGGGIRQARLFSDLPRPEQELAHAYRVGLGDLAASEPGSDAHVLARAESLGTLLKTLPWGTLIPAHWAASTGDSQRQGAPPLRSGSLGAVSFGAGSLGSGSLGAGGHGAGGHGRELFGLGSDPRGAVSGGGMLVPRDAVAVSARESSAASQDPYVAALVRERPRLHAWSQMEAVRASRAQSALPRAETSLF